MPFAMLAVPCKTRPPSPTTPRLQGVTGMLNWLLLFVPLTLALEYLAPQQHLLIFISAAVAIIPLAGWLGRGPQQLAERAGDGVGGLLNATFGNATELIIAIAALRAGLHDVVKASLAGSIIGNIL